VSLRRRLNGSRRVPASRAAFSPASISGLVAWYDFSAANTRSGGTYTGVIDRGPLGVDLTPSGAAATVVEAGQNGLDYALFNSTLDGTWPEGTWVIGGGGCTVIAVCKATLSPYGILESTVNGTANTGVAMFTFGAGIRFRSRPLSLAVQVDDTESLPLDWAILRGEVDSGGSVEMRVAGESTGSANYPHTLAGMTDVVLGQGAGLGLFQQPFGELLMFNRRLTASESALIEAWLQAKWATPYYVGAS